MAGSGSPADPFARPRKRSLRHRQEMRWLPRKALGFMGRELHDAPPRPWKSLRRTYKETLRVRLLRKPRRRRFRLTWMMETLSSNDNDIVSWRCVLLTELTVAVPRRNLDGGSALQCVPAERALMRLAHWLHADHLQARVRGPSHGPIVLSFFRDYKHKGTRVCESIYRSAFLRRMFPCRRDDI